jgi:hypothetical protein
MLLPGGLVIDQRDAVVDSMKGAPTDGFEITAGRPTNSSDARVGLNTAGLR